MSRVININYANKFSTKVSNWNLNDYSVNKLFSNGELFEINMSLAKSLISSLLSKFVNYEIECDMTMISSALMRIDVTRNGSKNKKRVLFKGLFGIKNVKHLLNDVNNFYNYIKIFP